MNKTNYLDLSIKLVNNKDEHGNLFGIMVYNTKNNKVVATTNFTNYEDQIVVPGAEKGFYFYKNYSVYKWDEGLLIPIIVGGEKCYIHYDYESGINLLSERNPCILRYKFNLNTYLADIDRGDERFAKSRTDHRYETELINKH